MKAIINTQTGLAVKGINPLTYADILEDVLVTSDDAAQTIASLLGDPHEPQSPPEAPYPTNHPPR